MTVATWSSANATACTASGGWTGTKALSGTESVPVAKDASLTLTCTNSTGPASGSVSVTTIQSWFNLPKSLGKWRSTIADLDGDGEDEILLPTIDSAGINAATPATPMYVLGVVNNRVVDKTPALFPAGAPKLFLGRVFVGDFDGNGKTDLMTCDRGRDVGPMVLSNDPNLTKGIHVSQNQIFLQGTAGTFSDFTAVYPQVLQDSWGCSSGDVDKSGRASIVQATFFSEQGFPVAWIAKWDGTRFNKTTDLVTVAGLPRWGWSATADFDKDGYADVAGDVNILWGGPNGGVVKPLGPSSMDLAGFTFHRGSVIADFNNDGYPDLVTVAGVDVPPTFGSARFALYNGGPNHSLVEKVGAFPPVSAYNPSDFGVEVNAIDINFDGYLDIVTTGHVYAFSNLDNEPRAVWINKGDGTFKLMHVSDELEGSFNCPASQSPLKYYEAYYLKTKDSKAFNYVLTGCVQGSSSPPYFARKVTPAYPLKFSP